MKLIVDANILVAELTRRRGRALLSRLDLRLFIAEVPWSEAQHELAKRYTVIAERTGSSAESADEQYTQVIQLAEVYVEVVTQTFYASSEQEARRRIPRDPDDWHTVALALSLSADIWTQDKDFLGCGVATWTTDTLL